MPMGQVFLATDADVAVALRMDGYLRDGARTGIPIGVYHAGGTDAPIYLDADFLIGPEAAHLNITGVSGLATKTSAIEWIMGSIFTHFPEQKGSIAAVCFNVKGPGPLLPRPARHDRRRRRGALREVWRPGRAVRERPVLRAVQVGRVLAQHAALERRAAAQCDVAHVGTARGAAVRRGAAQQGRRRREGRRADRLHSRADRGPRLQRSAPREQTLPRALVRRSRDVVPRRALGDGEQGERGVADAPRRDDPQGAEPAVQHLDPVRRAGHRRRGGQRPAVRELSGPHGVRDRRRLARGGRAGSDLRARRHSSFASTSRSATSASITSSCSSTS